VGNTILRQRHRRPVTPTSEASRRERPADIEYRDSVRNGAHETVLTSGPATSVRQRPGSASGQLGAAAVTGAGPITGKQTAERASAALIFSRPLAAERLRSGDDFTKCKACGFSQRRAARQRSHVPSSSQVLDTTSAASQRKHARASELEGDGPGRAATSCYAARHRCLNSLAETTGRVQVPVKSRVVGKRLPDGSRR
jgi:hypothetical protein